MTIKDTAARARVAASLEQAEALADMMCGENMSNANLSDIQKDALHFLLADLIRAAITDFDNCAFAPPAKQPSSKGPRHDYHRYLDAAGIENRAYQLSEIFKVIVYEAPISTGGQISIDCIALLGEQLSTELAQYASGDRPCILGYEPPIASKSAQHTTEEILHSYRQTVKAVEALIRVINAADLKRPVPVAERATIDDAVSEMMGHCDAARSDFLGDSHE